MSGVFDRLNKQISDQQQHQSDGLSPIEIAQLPPLQRQLMRMLLRELEMTDPALREALAGLPEGKRPTEDELNQALKEMVMDGWLIKLGEGDIVTYKANLRRKQPSTLAKSIWSALGSRIEEGKAVPPPAARSDDER